VIICGRCGPENPAGFRLCGICGAALEAESAREVWKTVTVLFADLSGSTAFGERLDPEALRRTMSRYDDELRARERPTSERARPSTSRRCLFR
jgi:hypothetical protein